ncbi:DUF7344 domain-containing protein [Halopelagius longus]|uniref:DUF7344 domain-containing protein n=1 Tax=Halopelagius longus TaxID=1236180 RepID=UPI00111440DE|nr:hypothetical protein [Halopelagius longus]
MTHELSERDPSEFDADGDRLDELFDVLSHRHRRFVLDTLLTAALPVPVKELTTDLVEWEANRPVSGRSGDERDGIEISLVHNHLPKMADAGFVRYDAADRTVTLADRTDEVRPYLQAVVADGGDD